MGCRNDYMEPSYRERESSRVIRLMQEVGLINSDPGIYGQPKELDTHTAQLCAFCQKKDVTNYSLELQIWWRDHQEMDKRRIQLEVDEASEAGEKEAALSKLTSREKKILGLD